MVGRGAEVTAGGSVITVATGGVPTCCESSSKVCRAEKVEEVWEGVGRGRGALESIGPLPLEPRLDHRTSRPELRKMDIVLARRELLLVEPGPGPVQTALR